QYKPEDTMVIARLAAETCFWPLYEVENGKYKITFKPREKKPVVEFLKSQDRFRHLFKPQNAGLLEELQKEIDLRWEELLAKETPSTSSGQGGK
ncbi:MAG: pyruvate ferredoxin oxidoreductase, partial [Candidatus Margulisiibacteriota bacterium]